MKKWRERVRGLLNRSGGKSFPDGFESRVYSTIAEYHAWDAYWETCKVRCWQLYYELLGSQQPAYRGFCYACGAERDFRIEYDPLWFRGNFLCPVCRLGNRMRAFAKLFDETLRAKEREGVYMGEQVTPLFEYVKGRYAKVTGSEYLNPARASGTVREDGLRHEDMTRHSFSDGAFGCYVSLECLEHIPAYKSALREMVRVLKPGGVAIVSTPYYPRQEKTLVRAQLLENGEIEHLVEPEYHGDPVGSGGILSYNTFGADLLDVFREVGFSKVEVVTYFSMVYAHPSEDGQEYFVAVK